MILYQLQSMAALAILAVLRLNLANADASSKSAFLDLKGKDDSFWFDSPAKDFPAPRDNLPNPEPNLRQLNSRKIKKYLGDLDTRFVSVKKPRVRNGTRGAGETLSRKELLASMPSDLKSLQFTVFGSERELGNRASKKLRLWLWSMSSCPVLPRWKDFGATVWPRYINLGLCSHKATCSYPKGMECKPSKVKVIPILWWFCSERLRLKDSPCTWVKFHTKVVEKCACSCKTRAQEIDSLLHLLDKSKS